jgi:hypothetical protein
MGGSKGSYSYSGMLFARGVEDNSTSPVNCLPLYCHWNVNKSCVLFMLRRLPRPITAHVKVCIPWYQRYQRWPLTEDAEVEFGPLQPSRIKGQKKSAWVDLR